MPDHGHGSPIPAVVTPAGENGEYTVSPINMWMPGLWRTDIRLAPDAYACTQVDNPPDGSIAFSFCING